MTIIHVETSTPLSPAQTASLHQAALRCLPAHLGVVVDGESIRGQDLPTPMLTVVNSAEVWGGTSSAEEAGHTRVAQINETEFVASWQVNIMPSGENSEIQAAWCSVDAATGALTADPAATLYVAAKYIRNAELAYLGTEPIGGFESDVFLLAYVDRSTEDPSTPLPDRFSFRTAHRRRDTGAWTVEAAITITTGEVASSNSGSNYHRLVPLDATSVAVTYEDTADLAQTVVVTRDPLDETWTISPACDYTNNVGTRQVYSTKTFDIAPLGGRRCLLAHAQAGPYLVTTIVDYTSETPVVIDQVYQALSWEEARSGTLSIVPTDTTGKYLVTTTDDTEGGSRAYEVLVDGDALSPLGVAALTEDPSLPHAYIYDFAARHWYTEYGTENYLQIGSPLLSSEGQPEFSRFSINQYVGDIEPSLDTIGSGIAMVDTNVRDPTLHRLQEGVVVGVIADQASLDRAIVLTVSRVPEPSP